MRLISATIIAMCLAIQVACVVLHDPYTIITLSWVEMYALIVFYMYTVWEDKTIFRTRYHEAPTPMRTHVHTMSFEDVVVGGGYRDYDFNLEVDLLREEVPGD